MEGPVILLLSLSLAVELLILLVVTVHYVHWRRLNQPFGTETVPAPPSPSIFQDAVKPLSNMEKKYLLLFMEGKTTEEVSAAMHVEPSSVYTMKYRIRKKFPEGYILPF